MGQQSNESNLNSALKYADDYLASLGKLYQSACHLLQVLFRKCLYRCLITNSLRTVHKAQLAQCPFSCLLCVYTCFVWDLRSLSLLELSSIQHESVELVEQISSSQRCPLWKLTFDVFDISVYSPGLSFSAGNASQVNPGQNFIRLLGESALKQPSTFVIAAKYAVNTSSKLWMMTTCFQLPRNGLFFGWDPCGQNVFVPDQTN